MTLRIVERSLLLPYSPAQMFALVNDVACYPQFLPGCAAVRIVEQEMSSMIVAIDVRKGPLHLSFTTRNRLDPDRAIELELIEGALHSLHGGWRFDDIAGKGSRVGLKLEYDFSTLATHLLLEPVFERVCHSIVGAFARRASEIYGRTRAPF
jgi:ribosome-associated toxin RatA of RatAB toxin-antitoxin module